MIGKSSATPLERQPRPPYPRLHHRVITPGHRRAARLLTEMRGVGTTLASTPVDPDVDWLSTACFGNSVFLVLAAEISVATLDAAIARLNSDRVATIRIRNPLAAPLSFERAMLQLAPENSDQDVLSLMGKRSLVSAMTARAAGRPCLLVVVEQAETLTVSALTLLELLSGLEIPDVDRVRVAFLGGPAFDRLLSEPRFQTARDHSAWLAAPRDAHLPQADTAAAPIAVLPSVDSSPVRQRRLIKIFGAAAVAVVVLLAVAIWPGSPPTTDAPVSLPALAQDEPASAPTPQEEVTQASSPVVAAAIPPSRSVLPAEEALVPPPVEPAPPSAAPPAVAEDPVVARARIFREFNAFLEARGLAGRLSRSDREALFQEYLVRHHTAAAPAVAPAASNRPEASVASELPEVLLFFKATQPDIEGTANEIAATLRSQVPDVTLHRVSESLSDPIVNYFRPEDRDLALSVALSLPRAATEWKVVDMSGTAGRPTRPTIEVWLPRELVVP
jgi:hypothetical protein